MNTIKSFGTFAKDNVLRVGVKGSLTFAGNMAARGVTSLPAGYFGLARATTSKIIKWISEPVWEEVGSFNKGAKNTNTIPPVCFQNPNVRKFVATAIPVAVSTAVVGIPLATVVTWLGFSTLVNPVIKGLWNVWVRDETEYKLVREFVPNVIRTATGAGLAGLVFQKMHLGSPQQIIAFIAVKGLVSALGMKFFSEDYNLSKRRYFLKPNQYSAVKIAANVAAVAASLYAGNPLITTAMYMGAAYVSELAPSVIFSAIVDMK